MKKLILTVLTICVFVITNAQEKANHNTTRSNRTNGIMVKEDLKYKFDVSKIRKLNIWELTTKDYVLLSEDNHYYTYDGNKSVVEKHFKAKLQNQTKMACPSGFTPDNNGGCFKFMKICGSSSSTSLGGEEYVEEEICLLINYVEDLSTFNLTGKIVINKNDKTYVAKKSKALLNLIKDAEHNKKMLKQNSNDCPDGCFCFSGDVICVDIKEDFPSYKKEDNSINKKILKKRNKNFNRKGERVKRTKF